MTEYIPNIEVNSMGEGISITVYGVAGPANQFLSRDDARALVSKIESELG